MKNVGDVNVRRDTQGLNVRRMITLCKLAFTVLDKTDKQAVRYHRLLYVVLDDHGWWKCHVVDDYWGYETALDPKLGYWDKYET